MNDIRHNVLSPKARKKSPFESSEEATLRKAFAEAEKMWTVYQNYLKAIAKPNVRSVTVQRGKTDMENGFKNSLGVWSKKLPPIFAKVGMKVVSTDVDIIHFIYAQA